jgi:TolA-binding protein
MRDPLIGGLIASGLAYAYEGKKDYAKAARYFSAVASDPRAGFREDAMLGLGRVYEAMGEREKSRETYKKFIETYPKSMYFNLVKEKMAGANSKP